MVAAGLILSHLFQFWIWFSRFLIWKSRNAEVDDHLGDVPFVSVIIAAKNEADNLPINLPFVLDQNYPNYEVILIDDNSTDHSLSIVKKMQFDYSHLSLIQSSHTGKKQALQEGIEVARGEWIICTDADCRPNSKNWLISLMRDHDRADVILGYGAYERENKRVNYFQRYETWFIAWQYMSAAMKGNPYMGVGRNMAYRKNVFLKAEGFKTHSHIKSGDDDLFISNLQNVNYNIVTHPNSWTVSQPPESWRMLWEQKRRHLTTAPHYKIKTKLLLALEFLSQWSIYLLSVIALWCGYYWAMPLLLFRIIYLYLFSWRSMHLLGSRDLHLFAPFLDFLLCIYYTLHGIGMLWPKKSW